MNRTIIKDISFLSYYQSALRNILVFTTIALALIREAFVFKNRNMLYNTVYLVFSFLFLSIAILINYILLKDSITYNNTLSKKNKSVTINVDINILYIMLTIIVVKAHHQIIIIISYKKYFVFMKGQYHI